MKPFAAIRVLGWLTVACLLQAWLASSSLLASCGDYVMVGGHGRLAAADFGHSTTSGDGHLSAGSGDKQMPCRGPHCSRRSAPSPEPPATVSSTSHDWCLPATPALNFGRQPLELVVEGQPAHQLLRSDLLFRPPRCA